MAPAAVPTLHLAGLGLHLGHVTREVERVLCECEHVYYLHGDPQTVTFLRDRCPSLSDLSDFYVTGSSRLESYYRIAARVISHALGGRAVGVGLYGHPTILSTLSSMLIAGGRRFGVRLCVYPGVSSLDVILAELGLDPGAVALQVHEATELLVFDRELDPSSGVLIFQAGQLETRLHTTTPSSAGRLRHLVARLASTYGCSHGVTALEVAGARPGWTWRGALTDLTAAAPAFGASFTIYVPPCERPPIRDARLLSELDDVSRLQNLVQ